MKIIGKIVYILWAAVIAIVLSFYCFSCYMGYRVTQIATSAIESRGEDFVKFADVIEENNFIKLWHEKPDNASYDKVQMDELGITQKYTLSRPYIMPFKDNNSFISMAKIGYIYNIQMYDANSTEVKSVALENSKIVLDVSYDGADFRIEKVSYDNDFDEYKVAKGHGIALAVILLINAVARNIRYFDYCVIRRKKRNILRFIQPYIFVALIVAAIFFDALPYALVIGIGEEIIFTAIYILIRLINRKKAC